MKYDSRRNRQRNSVFIFKNVIIFLIEIKAQSLVKLRGSDRAATILKVYCDKKLFTLN